MTTWAQAMQDIEKKTNKPYLHYRLKTKKNVVAKMNPNMMKRVLESQQNIFYNRFNDLNNTSFKREDIDSLLEDWTTNGVVGQKLAQQMNRISGLIGSGQYGTAAGLRLSNGNSLTLESKSISTKATATEILNSCSRVISAVDNYIANAINILADNNENILAQEILLRYQAGGGGTTINLPGVNGKRLTRSMLNISETNVAQLIQKLNTIMGNIRNLGYGSGQTAPSGKIYQEYLNSLEGVFQSLGGTIHELVVGHGVNVAAGIGNGALKKSEKQIAAMVKRTGGSFYSHWDAQDIDEGKQTKNDITVYYNKNGVMVTLGGNVKLRQGKSFYGSDMKTVEGLVARNESYETIARKMEEYAPGITQYGYEMAGALGDTSDLSKFNGDWWKMKQLAGALTLVDALSGLGLEKGDFSSLFIVNHKIFSMADILKKIVERGEGDFEKSRNRAFNVDFSLSGVRSAIKTETKKSNKKKTVYGEAYFRNIHTYDILAKTKISISINLGALYGKSVF